jgi:hypothetical protein
MEKTQMENVQSVTTWGKKAANQQKAAKQNPSRYGN